LMARIQAGRLALDRETRQAETALGYRRVEAEEQHSIRTNTTNQQQLTDNREQNRSINQLANSKMMDDRVTNANQARQTAYQNEVSAAAAEHQAAVEAWRWNQENASRPGQLLMLAGSRLMGGAS